MVATIFTLFSNKKNDLLNEKQVVFYIPKIYGLNL